MPYRTVGQAGATTGGPTRSGGPTGSGAKGSGPKVPYREVSGTKAGSEPNAPDPTKTEPTAPPRTPGFQGTGSKVTVTVDDDHLDDVEGLAEKLRAEGLEVDQVLGDVGIITGSVPADKRDSVGGVEGVVAVDDEIDFQLPPPEAGIQ